MCLQSHKYGECKSKYNCKICDNKHNTLLHFESKKPTNNERSSLCATTSNYDNEIEEETVVSMNSSVPTKSSGGLLTTAMVRVETRTGEKIYLRALIDAGSQSAFITEEAIQLLKLPKMSITATFSGMGGERKSSKHSAVITVYSRFPENEFSLSTEAIVLSKLTNYVTPADDYRRYEHIQNLCLADSIQGKSEPVDLVLGVIEHAKIIKAGLQKGKDNEPVAQDIEFGWLVFGSVKKPY